MKFTKFILPTIACIGIINANAQSFDYATALGGSTQAKVTAVAIDKDYNIIVAGTFRETIVIGPNTFTFTTNTQDNVFIAKFDRASNHIWSKAYESTGSGKLNLKSMAVHSATGNIAVTGEFSGSADFEGTIISEPNNRKSLFTALINSSGQLQWVSASNGATSSIQLEGRAIDFDGNDIIVGGYLEGGTHTMGSFTLTNPGTKGVGFVVKYNSAGTVTNAATVITAGNESGEINSLKANNGKIYILGTMKKNDAVVGSGTTVSVTNSSGKDQFVLFVLESNFAASWAKTSSSNTKSKGLDLVIDTDGSIFILCEFEENITLTTTISLENYSKKSSFIARYNASGDIQWAAAPKSSSVNAEMKLKKLALSQNHIFASGEFFLDYVVGNSSINTTTSVNGVIVAYNYNGNAVSASHFSSSDQCKLDAISSKGNMLVTGGEMRADINVPGMATPLELIGATGSRNGFFSISNQLNTLSVKELAQTNNYDVFPNPFNSYITIRSSENDDFKKKTISVLDVSGKLIYQQESVGANTNLNLEFLQAGIYFIKIGDNSETIKKIIKQ